MYIQRLIRVKYPNKAVNYSDRTHVVLYFSKFAMVTMYSSYLCQHVYSNVILYDNSLSQNVSNCTKPFSTCYNILTSCVHANSFTP